MTLSFLKSESETIQYVEEQARIALPPDWRIERIEGGRFRWRIRPPGEELRDYLLHFSEDCAEIVVLYGNTDAGALTLEKLLLKAKVIQVQALMMFPLSKAIENIVRTCEPNHWGLT